MTALSLLLVSLALLAPLSSAYDYVVIGGGTAGLTVASRLSDNPDISVAVIEAGFDAEHLPEVYTPGLIGTGLEFTTLDYSYNTVPQPNCNNRNIFIHAGKALGGTTILNGMTLPRAGKEQYDAWGILNNDASDWSWDSLFPYFLRTEKAIPPNDYQLHTGGVTYDPAVHGTEGRLKTGFANFFWPQSTSWRNACIAVGYPQSPDLGNGDPQAVGVTMNSLDALNNTRCSAACAYYTPFKDRTNLRVFQNSTVSRIIWSQSARLKGVATGVEYIYNNQTLQVPVDGEVILSAGWWGSPKTLELSGVGNATILRTAGIQPYITLPAVGENLADGVHTYVNHFTDIPTKDQVFYNQSFNLEQLQLWQSNRSGILSSAPTSLGLAPDSLIFEQEQLQSLISRARTNLQRTASDFSNGNSDVAKGIAAQHSMLLDLYEKGMARPIETTLEPSYSGQMPLGVRPNVSYSSINVVLYQPMSRGRTHINTSDPFAMPVVDPHYLSHELDIEPMVNGIGLARKMFNTTDLASISKEEYEPGANMTAHDDLAKWLGEVMISEYQETGTLAMLPQELGGVVDTSLKVYGTANVRVVDASIIPYPISSHLQATVYAIGEKAVDIILREREASSPSSRRRHV